MVTLEDLYGHWIDHPDATPERKAASTAFLLKARKLYDMAIADHVVFPVNIRKTNTQVSGDVYGGFRPQSCPIGAPHSAHKEGQGLDWFDPEGKIDEWCMKNQGKLIACGIYIEHPDSTPGWSHWSDRAPGSGHHVFYP